MGLQQVKKLATPLKVVTDGRIWWDPMGDKFFANYALKNGLTKIRINNWKGWVEGNNPFLPNQHFCGFYYLTPEDFLRQWGTPWAGKG